MSGRIRDEVIAAIRERLPLDQVIGDYVALKPAGAGRMKGLCPFHDEKTPSFNVNVSLGFFKCFGCGASGDAITFVREIDHLSFTDAVEVLARKSGVEVVYEQGGAAPRQQSSQRQRLLDAHAAAAAYFVEQLSSPEAEIGRAFLRERGFDEAAWRHFGVGYAPNDWETLTRHLRAKGYTNEELLAGGLATQGQRGTPYDRFRGRLTWPIRDMKGDVIGFGARRLHDDDQGPKYLNTPETSLYKKSQVLYGVDLAKNDIAGRYKAVVVEGYTDVMACHLAGETTAVATCGTAFGVEHIQVLRRLLMDQDEFRGRVIFTFDGDEAGRKAALKAFSDDQRFVTQTFVAVQPDGLDPCELRQRHGDVAVRDLIASHLPLAEFAIRSTLERFDLEIPEGRVQALAAAAPVVATLKDWSLRDEYARRLAGWLGMDEQSVLARVRGGEAAPEQSRAPRRQAAQPAVRPDPRDPGLVVEREVAKIAVQRPVLLGPEFDALDAVVFTAPAYAAIKTAVAKVGGAATATAGPDWVAKLQEAAEIDSVRELVTELAVEALQVKDESDPRYAASLVARLEEMALTREIQQLKSRLQRLNPVEAAADYNRLFGELIVLEQRKKALRERGLGA
ncbi:MAG TPA: DNA primase, partial [Mycobacteriales bacterium]|nr:DNA primase [Mycobacteriales bacterium]